MELAKQFFAAVNMKIFSDVIQRGKSGKVLQILGTKRKFHESDQKGNGTEDVIV